jgi:hypothetical protein
MILRAPRTGMGDENCRPQFTGLRVQLRSFSVFWNLPVVVFEGTGLKAFAALI